MCIGRDFYAWGGADPRSGTRPRGGTGPRGHAATSAVSMIG